MFLFGILDNFQTAINATSTALDSSGSAARENAKVIDSLAGHIQALKAEWESLVNSKGFQDTGKMLVDVATGAIKIMKAFGGLPTLLAEILGIILVIKKQALLTVINKISLGLEVFSFTVRAAGGGLKGFATATKVAAESVGLFNIAMTAGILAVGLITTAVSNAKQAQAEYRQEVLSSVEAHEQNLRALTSNIDKYKELAKQTSLTSDEETEFNSIEEELLDALGNKAELLNGLTKGTKEYTETVEKLTQAEIENLKIAREQALAAAQAQAREVAKPVGRFTRMDYDISGAFGDAGTRVLEEQGLAQGGIGTASYEAYKDYTSGVISQEQYLIKVYQDKEKSLQALTDAAIEARRNNQDALADEIENSQSYKNTVRVLNEYKQAYEDLVQSKFNSLQGLAAENGATIQSRTEYQKLIEIIQENNELKEYEKDLYMGMAADTFPQYTKKLTDIFKETKDLLTPIKTNINNTKAYKDELSGLITELSNEKDAYSALKSASEEYNANGRLSLETLLNLTDKYPDYLQLLIENKGDLKAVEQAIRDKIQASIDDLKASAALELAQKSLGDSVTTLSGKFAALKSILNGTKESKDAMTDYLNRMAYIAELEKSLTNLGGGAGGSSAKSTTDAWKDAFTTAYNDLKSQRDRDLIDSKTYYAKLNELNEKYFANRMQYAEDYAKYQQELYKGEQEVFKEYIDSLEHEITMAGYNEEDSVSIIARYRQIQEALHAQAEKYRAMNIAGNQDLIDDLEEQWWQYQKKIDDLLEDQKKETQKRFESIRDSAVSAIEAEIKEAEDALEKMNSAIDERISALKEEEELLDNESETESKLLAIEEARKKLAQAKTQKVRVYREGKGFVYESDFDAVSQAQSELDQLLEEWELFQEKAKIADIIEELEAEKDANKKRTDETIEDLNRLKDAWDKSLDLSENISEYNDFLDELADMENKSYEERIEAVEDFVKAYNAEMSQLGATGSASGGSTFTSVGDLSARRSSGGVGYNANIDYSAQLAYAETHGAPADELVRLEASRNAKIEGEGLSYEKTYKYAPKDGYATGTTSADGYPHLVGESGPELYIPPTGSGIIPNQDTINLMSWANIKPQQLLGNLVGSGGGDTVFNFENINLPNVSNAEQFVNELKNFKTYAIQSQSVRN